MEVMFMKKLNGKVKRCASCVMPEVTGRFDFKDNGICERCSAHTQITKSTNQYKGIEAFRKKIAFYDKGRSHYNCAVSVSGGKDSLMTLYIAKKKLGLNVLGIFVDNGFVPPEMYENIKNAADILDVDVITYKTSQIKQVFKLCLESQREFYYCRICHTLLDYYVRRICYQNNIDILLGGYTKGQQYITNSELFWIYNISDKNIKELIDREDVGSDLAKLFANPMIYLAEEYGNIVSLSPFKYIEWNENEILSILKKELRFKLPEESWPDKSSNCYFNYVAQLKSEIDFGYSQHDTEISDLIRSGEITRERGLEIIETPIYKHHLEKALSLIGVQLSNVFEFNVRT